MNALSRPSKNAHAMFVLSVMVTLYQGATSLAAGVACLRRGDNPKNLGYRRHNQVVDADFVSKLIRVSRVNVRSVTCGY